MTTAGLFKEYNLDFLQFCIACPYKLIEIRIGTVSSRKFLRGELIFCSFSFIKNEI